MTDPANLRIYGSNFDEFSRSLTVAVKALPPELSKRLHHIRRTYFSKYGFDGGYSRMNDRTVAQIFLEYEPVDSKPIAGGELDGIRYELYPPPDAKLEDNDG